MTDEGPGRISDREVSLAITGYFMPTHAANTPVLIGMPGTDDLFMLVFSTEEKLREAMSSFEISYERVARVTDGPELIAEVNATNERGDRPYRIRLAVDPYKGDNGRVRFVEPLLEEPSPAPSSPSALATMQHADECKVVRENGVAVWTCVGTCPAMQEFIRSGQVDHQPWDQLDAAQRETVIAVVAGSMEHALAAQDDRSKGDR